MIRLPTFKGYTVDVRLGEFRKIPRDKLPEWVPFDSAKGRRLLIAYLMRKRYV